jgi:hypothetical protein
MFGNRIAPGLASITLGGLEMQPTILWPALMVLAGAVVTAPAVENGSHRAILYWLILPSLAVGVAAMFSRVSAF